MGSIPSRPSNLFCRDRTVGRSSVALGFDSLLPGLRLRESYGQRYGGSTPHRVPLWRMTKNSADTLTNRNVLRQRWKASIDPTTVAPFKIGVCKDCNTVSELRWATTFSQTGRPEYRSRCESCDRIFYSEQTKRRRRSISDAAKARRTARKLECVSYLGGSCSRCGYSRSAHALTFHHRNRDEKEYGVATILDYSPENLRKELDRCELVCFNCHMEIEEEHRRV